MPTVSPPSDLMEGVFEVTKLAIIGMAVQNKPTDGDVHTANGQTGVKLLEELVSFFISCTFKHVTLL